MCKRTARLRTWSSRTPILRHSTRLSRGLAIVGRSRCFEPSATALFFTADTHFGDHRTTNIHHRPFADVVPRSLPVEMSLSALRTRCGTSGTSHADGQR